MKSTFISILILISSVLAYGQDVDLGRSLGKMAEDYENLPGKVSECSAFNNFIIGLGDISSFSDSPLDFRRRKSLELFAYSMYSNHISGNLYWIHGHGFGWKNLTLDNGYAMSMTNSGDIVVEDYPLGASPKVSRLRVFSYSIPTMLTYDLGGGNGLSLGTVLNANLGSCINTKYRINGEKQKDKYKYVNSNFFTVDLMAAVTLNKASFWIKYCPMPLMDRSYWPDIETLTFGITL